MLDPAAARAVLAAWDRDTRAWAAYFFSPEKGRSLDAYPEPPFEQVARDRLGVLLDPPNEAAFQRPNGQELHFWCPSVPALLEELRARFRL